MSISPSVNGKGASWIEITSRAEAERIVLCKHLEGKSLFTAMLRLYAVTHRELRDSLQPEPDQEEATEEFREQRRRKQNPSNEQPAVLKKTAGSLPAKTSATVVSSPPKAVVTRNFFSPPSEWLTWTPILRRPRARHVKSQLPAKQVDRPQEY
jgi:hypothetical protein